MAEAKSFSLLCLENPLLDIQAKGDQALLEKYGLKANDAILAEDKHMTLYDELLSRDAKIIAGGAAQNTARGAQYCLPPNSVWYIGCVGKDDAAKQLTTACENEGVHTEYRIDDAQPTGKCGVIITGHHRSMVTHLAAANEYKLDHLTQPHVWSLVEKTSVFYIGGYHLTVCPPAILKLGEEAASKNKIFALGFSAPFILQFFKDPLAEVLPYTDYIFCNEAEAEAWAQANGHETKSVPEIAKLIAKLPKKNEKRPRTVIITQGTEPTISAIAKADGDVDVKEYSVHAIREEQINDTNGAGDAFAGGFMAALVEGKPLEACVDQGQWLARLGIQELGASYPFPKQAYNPS